MVACVFMFVLLCRRDAHTLTAIDSCGVQRCDLPRVDPVQFAGLPAGRFRVPHGWPVRESLFPVHTAGGEGQRRLHAGQGRRQAVRASALAVHKLLPNLKPLKLASLYIPTTFLFIQYHHGR